ncbi:MAG: hypothetical protein COV01_02625 [Candidatus Taylorbacteria bacterium CG10_big_fil_rev_8_21_14_0_10_41_48]|uniref:Uncharacterized protein n=1 Tax=Candidatus Taylorbacteria bacterium CG10_big_fil_rev_8_21_14_0_10_41_48 TaxID=1975024 RepID=A0A2M8LBZ8_9BACT|nr:MAG: hypothetical protein COV01_02625 [Candidatus Taylorbacteria bacterium CG10_big_fil_rev_8_21_14_0_10_41_48]
MNISQTKLNIIAIYVAFFLISFALLIPGGVFGQETGIVPCNGPDCNFCSLAQLGQNIINLAIFLAVFLSAILFAWAGWNYLTNFGDTGKVSKAHEIFRNVAVGFIIVLAAWLIVDTLMKTLLGGKFGPWNEVCGGSAANASQTGGLILDGSFRDVYDRALDNQQ